MANTTTATTAMAANHQVDQSTYNMAKFMLQGQRENTELSQRFFHRDNVAKLQEGIRRGVHQSSVGRFNVGNQSETNLQLVMQHLFFEEAHYMESNVGAQLHALNAKVLDYCVENVYNNYINYAKYYRDSQTLHVPMDRPECVRPNQHKTLEFKGWF